MAFLPGFSKGLSYLFMPDFSKLFTFQIWQDALVQVIFQLSIGTGGISTFTSFRSSKSKVVLPSRLIPLINSFTGIVASLIIFGYLGYFSTKVGVSISDLKINGPGLLFVTIPACLSTMALPNLWLFVFFFNLILIGIDSQFGLVETVSYFFEDLKLRYSGEELKPQHVKAAVCLCLCLLGLPIATRGGTYVIELLDTFAFALPNTLVVLMEVLVWGMHVIKSSEADKGGQTYRPNYKEH